MSRLKLNPEPTFKMRVGIPVPGKGEIPVEFTFKHRTREQLMDMAKAISKEADDADESENAIAALLAKDVASVIECVAGWDLDDAFTPENVHRLCNTYSGAAFAIVNAYMEELRGARAKN